MHRSSSRASRLHFGTINTGQIVKTGSQVSKPRSTAPVLVSWSTGVIRLRNEDLFGKRLGELFVVFLRRIFALSEVKSVEIDRDEFTAEIRFDADHGEIVEHLQRMAGAIRWGDC